MARQAQTSTAVLGALSVEPMTGYEIRQVIADVLGHFWHESFGQIYP
jgi:DNA-binding PadR family transcriptional regulator